MWSLRLKELFKWSLSFLLAGGKLLTTQAQAGRMWPLQPSELKSCVLKCCYIVLTSYMQQLVKKNTTYIKAFYMHYSIMMKNTVINHFSGICFKVQHCLLFYLVIILSINYTNICEINHIKFQWAVADFVPTNSKRLWWCTKQEFILNLWQAIFGHSILVRLPCCAVGQVSLHMLKTPWWGERRPTHLGSLVSALYISDFFNLLPKCTVLCFEVLSS